MATSPVLQNPDPHDAYQAVFDALDRAYWDASDIDSKDLIHSVQGEVGSILTAMNQQQLADNTALFTQIGGQIKTTNDALKKIQASIDSITKNINTAATVLSSISRVLSLFP
jgi:methyl-accepting chemotaxis protein